MRRLIARLAERPPRWLLSLIATLRVLRTHFKSIPPLWSAVITVGLASLARLPWLTWHSVDLDEAFSLYWARVPLCKLIPDLLSLRGDPLPPGYYALLKPWIALLGENEIGLRLFSVFAGIIFVALVYCLGRQLFSTRVGFVAAFLAAINPALVFESLDARMYMPAAVFALAGSLALWCAVGRGGWVRFVAAFAWLTLACYSHVFGSLVVASLGAGLIIARKKRFWQGVSTLAAVGLAYLPYAINAWRTGEVQGAIYRRAPGFGEVLRFAANWSLFHQAPLASWVVGISSMVLWVIAVWGLARKTGSIQARGWVAGNLIVPLLLVVILSQRQALLQPKLLVVTTLAPLLLAMSLPRSAWVVALLIVMEVWGYAALWRPEAQRENWRAAGAYLSSHVGPHDVVAVHLHYYQEPLRFYYPGSTIAPFGSRLTTYDEVATGLAPYLDREVLWLVQSGTWITDPDRLLENWLSQHYPLVTEQFPNRIAIKGFLLHPAGFPPLPGTLPLEVDFDGGARVAGVWLDAQRVPARDIWLHPPSNWIHVTLYATPADYVLSMEDQLGDVWGASLQRSGPEVQAEPDQMVRLDYDINLNPETPPGVYKVVLRVAGPQEYASRADNGNDYLILKEVRIVQSPNPFWR